MSYASERQTLREQRQQKNTTTTAGGVTPPATPTNTSSGESFASQRAKLREQRGNASISEKVKKRVKAIQLKRHSTSALDTFNNLARNTDRITTSGGYYSRPTLGSYSEKLYGNVTALEPILTEKRAALDTAQTSLLQAENDLKTVQGYLDQARAVYDADPTNENATSYNQIVGAYNLAYDAYASAFDAYSVAYNDYKPYEEQLVDALTAYQLYSNQQQSAFDAWRGTIRDTGAIETEMMELDARINQTEQEITNLKRLTRGRSDAFGQHMRESLQEAENRLQTMQQAKTLLLEEYDWSRYYRYNDLMQAADFAEKSRYATTANGLEPVLNKLSGMYTETGFNDLTYDYINRNQEAHNKAMVNSIGDNTALLGLDKSYLEKMTDDEIAIFNYLYATQGADAAYQYTAYLTGDLTRRQREEQEEKWKEYAEKDPLGSSVFSVMISPMKGLSYLGQFADYAADGQIDQNAAYNKFSYIPGSIRSEVVQQIEASGKWGKVGSFAYQTGLSMADFLLATALTGNNQALTMTIMGSGAAADATISAKDRGLSDNQAFALGTAAGILEGLIESVNMETVLKPDALKDGVIRYILKNATAEGMEEVATDIGNLIADVLIAGDRNTLQTSIDNYMKQGMTEGEAVARTFADQALQMIADFAGGALSGGIVSGTNAGIHDNYTNQMGNELGELDLDEEDIQAFIETGLESDPETASYQLAVEMQAKIEAGEALSNYDLARLYQANMQAIQAEEEDAEDLRDDTATDDQTDAVADDVTDPGGLSLPSVENDTRASGFVTQNAQNGTQTQVNDTVLPDGVPLSIADQLRREQAQNGGTQHERTYERAAGPATSQPAGELYVPGGASLPDGGRQRYDGASAPEQVGVLAGRARQAAPGDQARVHAARASVQRTNIGKNLRPEKVSSLDLGLQNGTEERNIQVIPREYWDEGMAAKAEQVLQETGKQVSYILGRMQVRNAKDDIIYVKGVNTGKRIIVQANNTQYTAEQIADHEAYHGMTDPDNYGQLLNDRIVERIQKTFSREEFDQVLGKYIDALSGIYDLGSARDGAEYEQRMNGIIEELLADAHAGMNMWGAGATKFTDTVNRFLDDNNISRKSEQDNGTEEPTGPPSDRYSFAGENANNADLDALARAKEMRSAGVADETIRQQTGWHTGMDGKWRWEIDDSGMEYSGRGDLGLRERRPEYARYRELLDKANRHALELSDEALTPEEAAELQKLKNIWGGTFRKAGRITEDALPTELLSDYVKHDALFEAYPQLRKTRLRFADLPEGTRGQYDPEQDIITLSNKLRGKPQDTLIHEIQHAIQKAEGFAQGSSPEFWEGQQVVPPEYASEIQKAEDTVKKVEAEFHQEWPDDINLNLVKQYIELDNQLWGDGTDPIALQELADQMDQIEQLATESGWGGLFNDYYYAVGQLQMAKERAKLHRRAPIDLYRNTAGEIEARDAASRRQLTAEQRRNTAPVRADDRTVFVEDIDGAAIAELDTQYGPQLQSAAEFDQDTISSNIQQVAQMEPVTSISGQEFAKGEVDLITQVETFFNQRGNRAYSPELGEVILDRKGVKSDIAHGIGRKKAAAFAAVPDVIEHGLVVDYQKDWKGRGYDTAVVAAPITIGDQTHAAAVILLRSDQTNRFYVHEVLAMENGALPFKTGTREGYPGGDAPSILSILDKIRSVKNGSTSQEKFSVEDDAYMEAVNNGDMKAAQRMVDAAAERWGAYLNNDEANEVFRQDGRVRTFYHGTNTGDFTKFDSRLLGSSSGDLGWFGKGFYFAFSHDEAATYGGRVIPAYLRMSNPYDYSRLYQFKGSDKGAAEYARFAWVYNITKQFPDIAEGQHVWAYPNDAEEGSAVSWKQLTTWMDQIQNKKQFTVEEVELNDGTTAWELRADPKKESFNTASGETFEWTEYGMTQIFATEQDAKEPINQIGAYLKNVMGVDSVPRRTIEKIDFSGALQRAGYDGILQSMNGDEAVVFSPEQIKTSEPVTYDDEGKVIPLSKRFSSRNPDIRYSVDDEGSQQAQEQKPAAPKKKIRPVAESRPLIAKKDLRNTVLNLFSIPNGQRAEVGAMIDSYADRLIKNGSLTEDDRKAFFDRMYDAGVMVMPAEEYSAFARSHIVDGRIYVSDSVKSDFGDDWADIRRRAFAAGVYLVNDRSASGIDQWNATLSAEDMLPGLFDSEETDERTILERILQVAEEGKDEHLSLAEYTRRLSQQEGISEDEFLDNMERQLDWALRTFAEKARLEVHLRDRTGRKIAQEREKGAERMTRQQAKEAQRRADERQARKDSARRAKERRELRELQQRTLKQLQWLSRNRNRAPEELQATWDDVLGDIDLYAISAADEMRWSDKYNATWQDIVTMYDKAKEEDPNFFESKELERMVVRLRNKKIADLDIDALNDLYRLAVGLRTTFYNRKNVLADDRHRLFAEVYTDSVKEIMNAPKSSDGTIADKVLNWAQLTPMNLMQRMGGWDPDGVFYSMAKQLERGERDVRAYSVKAQKMLQDFLTEHEDWVKKADGQGKDAIWYEVEIPELMALRMGEKPVFGKTIKVWMTPAQKVHMFLESKNPDNLRHMTGGRCFVDKDLYSKGKRQEAFEKGPKVRLAPETVRAIVSDLTPEEMELAQILDRYYNTFATQEINNVSNILYGYDKAMGRNYAPIYVNKNYANKEFGVFDVTVEGIGNLKERQKYSKNPSYNISAFDAFERHVDKTARFCGMAIPVRNWTNLMNWQGENDSMMAVIAREWNGEANKYIEKMINSLQGGDTYESDVVSTLAEKLQNNYISAVFGANPSIVLKQLGSIPLAGAYLDARNMPTPAQISKIDRSLISKYTQELEWRTMGYATPETKQLKDNPNWTQTNKAFKFVFGGGAITAMDGWAASTLWPWAENKVRREHPELTVGTKAQIDAGESAFYKKVAEEFEIAVSRSQSVSDEIHQGTLRKSKNPITKAFTMFRSDSAQTYNALRQKIGEARYYMRTGAKEKVIQTAKKAAGTAFVAMLINAAWSEAVSFLMALWKNKGKYYRDDEDELTFQSVAGEMVSNMLGSYAGVVTGGEEVFELIGNIITGDKWYGIETPGMEQLNNIMDVIYESGSGMRDLVAGGWDILKNGGNLGEYFNEHSGQILGNIKDLAETAAMYLPGLPASNLEAYLIGTLKWLSPELGTAYDDLFSNVRKDDLSKLTGDALKTRIGSIMESRGMGDNQEVAQILADLYEAGYKTAVPSDIPTSVSANGENRKLSAYQQQFYSTVWREVVNDSLEEMMSSDRFVVADKESQAKMVDNLYDYAAGCAKTQLLDTYCEVSDAVAKISAMKMNGVAPSEYIVWKVTTSGLKTSEKMTILREWDMSEEAKKTIVGTIIGTDLETETGKPSQYAKFLSSLEEGMTVDQYLSMRTDGVDVEDYLEATESGLDSDDALNLATAKSQLEPDAGAERVSDLQKWRASVDFSDDVEDQLTALSMVMDDYEFINVEIANIFGIAPDAYVRFYEIRSQYDADGSGGYKQVEIQAAIDAQFGHLSQQQKAALWQLMNSTTKSAKKNPYSKEVGQQVLDAKAAAKEAVGKEQDQAPVDGVNNDTFSQELLNQLLGRG